MTIEMTFENWMKEVDREIGKLTGMGLDHNDLPDMMYHDAFDGGSTPAEVAREVLEEEGFPFED